MERSIIVRVHEGLHARPATRFVKLAKSFESNIEIIRDGKAVSAKSPVKLMLLGVKENQEVTVKATGADEVEAVEALIGYLGNPNSGVDDDEPQQQTKTQKEAAAPPPAHKPEHKIEPDAAGGLRGVAASEGVAFGQAFAHFPVEIKAQGRTLAPGEVEAEIGRLRDAIRVVQQRMDSTLDDVNLAEGDRGIIAALRDIAADESLVETAEKTVRKGLDAVSSVLAASMEVAAEFTDLEDPYLNARADDIRAVGRQICLALLGQDEAGLEAMPAGSILIAEDIGAWDLARAPLKRIAGIVCGHGGSTSHVAIIARSHGIPAVLGLGTGIDALKDVKEVALDGSSGRVYGDPDRSTREAFHSMIETAKREQQALSAYRDITPARPDGVVIEVAANIGSLEEIDAALEAGAMGVGLFRTELLFMRHMHLPSEDMQAETYAAVARAFAPHPVIVRTLDIGGDKPIAGIEFPQEENPFLGWRGIRMCLDRPDLFKTQLRALLRAAIHGNLKVMLPMVSEIDEVRRTRELIAECVCELEAEGKAHAAFALGVMIETPAAVLIAPELAKQVDFFSIGTNDLTQYIMAADRLNPVVSNLNNVENPAVMAAIELTAKAGTEAGIMVGMCGEAAGRPDLIPAFIKMGLTELSMSAASIPRAKKCIAGMGKTST